MNGGLDRLDWAKGGGLLPAIVQDARSGRVVITDDLLCE